MSKGVEYYDQGYMRMEPEIQTRPMYATHTSGTIYEQPEKEGCCVGCYSKFTLMIRNLFSKT